MLQYNSLLFGELFSDELTAAFSNRACGNMSFNYGNTLDSLANRRNFLEKRKIDYNNLVCGKQVHSARVKRVELAHKGLGVLSYETALEDTDAFITNEKNLPLAIFTADCLSVFLFDPQTRSIGLVHAGWKGTQDCIAQKTLDLMKKEFAVRPENVLAGFGPAMRSCCYEVEKDFSDKFPRNTLQRGKSFFLDLIAANREQLGFGGVQLVNMFDCMVCTSCQNAEYFSFRQENSLSGRMISVMMLR